MHRHLNQVIRLEPTHSPTQQPSVAPTLENVFNPSLAPSQQPSYIPTPFPHQPAPPPVPLPSQVPSHWPSWIPSLDPTRLVPSTWPSALPTALLTQVPRMLTRLPSAAPALFPSVINTTAPTALNATLTPTAASAVAGAAGMSTGAMVGVAALGMLGAAGFAYAGYKGYQWYYRQPSPSESVPLMYPSNKGPNAATRYSAWDFDDGCREQLPNSLYQPPTPRALSDPLSPPRSSRDLPRAVPLQNRITPSIYLGNITVTGTLSQEGLYKTQTCLYQNKEWIFETCPSEKTAFLAGYQHPNIEKPLYLVNDRSDLQGNTMGYLRETMISIDEAITRYAQATNLAPAQARIQYVGLHYRELIAALCHLQAKKYCHNDIRPANIRVMGDEQQWVLVGFGAADPLAAGEDYKAPNKPLELDRIHYLAPEQLMGQWRLAGDIYQMAMTLAELLTGEKPFNAFWQSLLVQRAPNLQNTIASPNEIRSFHGHLETGYRPVLPAETPPQLASLIQQCGQTLWNDRPKAVSLINDSPVHL